MQQVQQTEVPILRSFYLKHKDIGTVHVIARSNMRSITAHWKQGILQVGVPRGLYKSVLDEYLDRVGPRALDAKPNNYSPLDPITTDFFTVRFVRDASRPGYVWVKDNNRDSVIAVSSELDVNAPAVGRTISKVVLTLAAFQARVYDPQNHHLVGNRLLAEAAAVAEELGVKVLSWKMSRGIRTLGTCTALGVISISNAVMFLPADLRRFIYCHELAHITYPNHSTEFHALVNKYVGGTEKDCIDRIKHFNWPILK